MIMVTGTFWNWNVNVFMWYRSNVIYFKCNILRLPTQRFPNQGNRLVYKLEQTKGNLFIRQPLKLERKDVYLTEKY